MFSTRQTAIAVGVFFLLSHVTSVAAAFVFFAPVLGSDDYVLSSTPDTALLTGGVLEVILALAVVATSVAIFPLVRRHSEGFAIGYVALRTLEAGVILTGAVAMMTVSSLHEAALQSADPEPYVAISTAATSLYSWAFIVGPGLICPVNTVVLAVVLFRAGLVARFIPVLGFFGAPLVFALNLTKVFGVAEQLPEWASIGVVPLFAWEICLAVYLIVKGFASGNKVRETSLVGGHAA